MFKSVENTADAVQQQLIWLRASIETLGAGKSDKLGRYLWLAYKRLEDDQRVVLGRANVAAAIRRIVATADDNPELTRLTMEHLNIQEGRIFHQARAGHLRRKHDKTEFQAQHDQRVTEEAIAYYHLLTGRDPSPATVLSWLYHDSVEDYGVRFEQIATYSGEEVANAVRPVTIPPTEVLRQLYPGLTTRTELKNRFKADSMADYSADNLILKFHDNKDALVSYIRNMVLGQILVTSDPSRADPDHRPNIFDQTALLDNLAHRRRANRLLIERCAVIATDTIMNPEKLNTSFMAADFGAGFVSVCNDFTATVMTSGQAFDNAAALGIALDVPKPADFKAFFARFSNNAARIAASVAL